jgi:hypothetical protein
VTASQNPVTASQNPGDSFSKPLWQVFKAHDGFSKPGDSFSGTSHRLFQRKTTASVELLFAITYFSLPFLFVYTIYCYFGRGCDNA